MRPERSISGLLFLRRPDLQGLTPADLDAIADGSVDSLLVVSGEGPYCCATPRGLWTYRRPWLDPRAPSHVELRRMVDFIHYEKAHARSVGVLLPTDSTLTEADLLDAVGAPEQGERPVPDDPSCRRPFRSGCQARLVCHGTTAEAATAIVREGRLVAKAYLSRDAELESYSRLGNVGDPRDYLEYVCLANGDCVAPEIVVAARRKGIFQSPGEVDADFHPSVRLYFSFRQLAQHPGASFDGIHPIKIHRELDLRPYLVAVVVPKSDFGRLAATFRRDEYLQARLLILDDTRFRTIREWSDNAFRVARQKGEETEHRDR